MNSKVNPIKRLKNIAEVMKKYNLSYVEVEGFKVQMDAKPKNTSLPQPLEDQDPITLMDQEIESKLKAYEE